MAQDITTLASLYKDWDIYQGHLIQAIAPLTAEQLAFSIAPNLHTVGQIAAHIAFGRAAWTYRVVGKPFKNGCRYIVNVEILWAIFPPYLDRKTSNSDFCDPFMELFSSEISKFTEEGANEGGLSS
jgi:hypothetical protein